MISKTFTMAAAALATAGLVSAQTFTTCNPLEKTCPAEPAFGNKGADCDFTKGPCSALDTLPGTSVDYGKDGMVLTISKETEAPTLASHKRIFFGRLDVVLKAAPGQGIVTSVVLQSLDLDEIDWEWVGGDNAQVQTNYFGKGDTTTYDRGQYHPIDSPTTNFHKYTIIWTSKSILWQIDDNTVRTLKYADAKGGSRYPQTPMEVKIGTWVAGRKDAPKGTVDWAGGYADFSKGPFKAYYKSIKITDFGGSDSETDESIKEYLYGDKSGSWESIKVIKGDGTSDDKDDDDNKKTTKTGSKTKSSDHSATISEPSTTSSVSTLTRVANSTASVPTGSNTDDSSQTSPTSTSPAGSDDRQAGAAGIAVSFGSIALAAVVFLGHLF